MRNVHRSVGNRGGFTLVELLIVITVLGILAAIAVPAYLGQRTKAMRKEAESNLEIVRLLQEQYRAEQGEYAPAVAGASGSIPYKGTHGTSDGGIEDELPGFKPGAIASLKFNYTLYYTVSGGMTTAFAINATGKSGTGVSGMTMSLNQNNEWN